MTAFRLFPETGSTIAKHVDHLFIFLLIVSGAITLLVFVLIMTFALRYRRRRGDKTIPPATRTYTSLELTWTIVTFCLAMVMFAWGAKLYARMFDPPDSAMVVYVVAKQWMWKIQHPEGHREINELHVPVGQPVKLVMSSQDVIHDFFVPAFRIKHDVLPGRYTSLWFTATKPGSYHFFCSQYCGAGHADMVGQVIAMEPSRYEAWLAGTAPEQTPADAGAKLFVKFGCAGCHGVNAPTLAGLYRSQVTLQDGSQVTADERYIRDSILDSTSQVVQGYAPVMPSYRSQVSEVQMMQLLEYIKSLKDPAAEEGRIKKP
ncbi:MAG: cytochrome c oxidase subunit II [Phycisphaerales bacterium]|nr:cytochrome c oxidase subunit II [Phycisphaerales bacterium]